MRRALLGGVLIVGLVAGWRWAVVEPVAPFVARAVYGACRRGDVAGLAILRAAGVPLTGRWTRPLVGVAAEAGQVEAMEYLVAHGADVNGVGKFATPLELAIVAGQLDAVRWLLDHGARPDLAGAELPLAAAVRACQPEATRLLVDRGAPPLPDPERALAAAAAGGCIRTGELQGALR